MGKNKNKKRKIDCNKSDVFRNDEKLYESVIKEFSSLTKPTGLVVGTNEVLRRLERKQLAAVFLFSKKASPPIRHSLSVLCRKTDVPFITLSDQDKFVLGPKFPVSITYGVKLADMKNLQILAELLNKIKPASKSAKQTISPCGTSLKKSKVLSEENVVSLPLGSHSFYHEKHPTKLKENNMWPDQDFLSFQSLDKMVFPDYNSSVKSYEFSICIK